MAVRGAQSCAHAVLALNAVVWCEWVMNLARYANGKIETWNKIWKWQVMVSFMFTMEIYTREKHTCMHVFCSCVRISSRIGRGSAPSSPGNVGTCWSFFAPYMLSRWEHVGDECVVFSPLLGSFLSLLDGEDYKDFLVAVARRQSHRRMPWQKWSCSYKL